MDDTTFEVTSIVTNHFLKKESDGSQIKLVLELQMFDGQRRSLSFNLDYLPKLFDVFNFNNNLNFMHCIMQCLVRDRFKETPLGTMNLSYEIVAIRHNIHQKWLYLY